MYMKKLKLFLALWICFSILSTIYACNTSQNQQNNTLSELNDTLYKSQSPAPITPIPQTPTPVTPIPQTPTPSPAQPIQEDKALELGSFDTDILNNDPNRISNIELAIKSIDGFVLKPGKTFSFNKVVGERTEEKGYKESDILVDGESSQGIGGGVCQLSTTLYNTVKIAGLKTTERHEHSKAVGYVPKGQDATVNYGTKDYKFINNKDFSIIINASIDSQKVYVAISKES
jgi:vancomycin resistance protein YoaR